VKNRIVERSGSLSLQYSRTSTVEQSTARPQTCHTASSVHFQFWKWLYLVRDTAAQCELFLNTLICLLTYFLVSGWMKVIQCSLNERLPDVCLENKCVIFWL